MKRVAALAICGLVAWAATALAAPDRRWKIGFANLTDDPETKIEATGFTGNLVRDSFVLAARELPVDLVRRARRERQHEPDVLVCLVLCGRRQQHSVCALCAVARCDRES